MLLIISFILLGFLPSLVWLLFYLRKDVHPESNKMILKIFFYGMLAAIVAVLIEIIVESQLVSLLEIIKSDLLTLFILIFDWFIIVGFTEEILKYLTVKWGVLKHPQLDEPVDVILYMIIAALGFATLENIFIFLSIYPNLLASTGLALFRFISATFLHALCSGTIGYFLALSFLKQRKTFLFSGLTIAVLLHGLYNFSIIEIEGPLKILIPSIILIFLALFVSRGFKKLKKIKSICKIK